VTPTVVDTFDIFVTVQVNVVPVVSDVIVLVSQPFVDKIPLGSDHENATVTFDVYQLVEQAPPLHVAFTSGPVTKTRAPALGDRRAQSATAPQAASPCLGLTRLLERPSHDGRAGRG
jgi:hypothetical protein